MALVTGTLTILWNIASQAGAAYDYFLNSEISVVKYETIEISHSSLSQTFYFVRNNRFGLTATLETGETQEFTFAPMSVTPLGDGETLVQGYRIDLGDPGRILSDELSRVYAEDNFLEKPRLVFRAFRSDDTSEPIIGPDVLELTNVSFNREGATFEARAPELNALRTGESYAIDRFPGLKAFLK